MCELVRLSNISVHVGVVYEWPIVKTPDVGPTVFGSGSGV